ncbi:MAG: type I glyceraldehyde-3-phosphate dehydrogenase [Candidatus Pacebacteria bacterium]|nr:type I glyceraldehyde-3-phosphate dehydrogenase [Candidatus Paceibacterota bacterium]
MIKVAINGFGRIGRATAKIILDKHPELDLVAINDLGDPKTLAHLMKYDSLYGKYSVGLDGDHLLVGDKKIKIFSEKRPESIGWGDIDIVLECTGFFRDYDGAMGHIKSGAKKVIISAPSKSDQVPSFVLGVNEEELKPEDTIMDMGSCTTNCLAPILKVLEDDFGVDNGLMTTVHSYTNDQNILDVGHKDLRRARAAAINIIPTTTGAAKAVGRVIPSLQGKIDGFALRVPTPTVSIVDLTCNLKKETTAEEINSIFRSKSSQIIHVSDDPLVSSDYIGSEFSAIIDSSLTMVSGRTIKIVAWYDNEWGYSCRLADFAEYVDKI